VAKKLLAGSLGLLAALAAVAYALLPKDGFSARAEPSRLEELVARQARRLAVPRMARETKNPVTLTAEALARARAHFADHCATCHGNDGKGQTAFGRNLYPKAPDMTARATQTLGDGEIFWVISNGVRLTGMPAFGGDSPESAHETWELVHFIRHLPKLTADELEEMQALNPKSRRELEEQEQVKRFLEGR
jgi:mono/diheme cytochrome c family protein